MSSSLLCAVLSILVVAVLAAPKWHELTSYTFEQYTKDFNKVYAPKDRMIREKLFNEKLAEVQRFNAEGHSYKMGINHMSDWTKGERRAIKGNHPMAPKPATTPVHKVSGVKLPYAVDYRIANPSVLTAVKDQGTCGSCWAHAATEEVESLIAITTGQLFVLSQQQLVSCVTNSLHCGGTGGCGGATAEVAFQYLVENGGMTQEWMYGYQSYFGVTPPCAYNATQTVPVVKIAGYTMTPRNDVFAVMDAVATVGPLAISVDASTWFDYESGIFSGCDYAKNISMDHAVQLIGYGHDGVSGQDYWLVRNSWSPAWGELGFIRLQREATPSCGWNVEWDTNGGGCPGQPDTVWACGQCGILYDTLYPNPDA